MTNWRQKSHWWLLKYKSLKKKKRKNEKKIPVQNIRRNWKNEKVEEGSNIARSSHKYEEDSIQLEDCMVRIRLRELDCSEVEKAGCNPDNGDFEGTRNLWASFGVYIKLEASCLVGHKDLQFVFYYLRMEVENEGAFRSLA